MLRRSLLAAPAAFAFAQSNPAAFPAGVRMGHVLAYDNRRRELLLFGAGPQVAGGAEPLWVQSGGNWRSVTTAGPPSRTMPAGAYDAKRGRFVIYGGLMGPWSTRYGDAWEWDGSSWQQSLAIGPGPRDHHAMAYDSARERIVMHGGSVFIFVRSSSGESKDGSRLWYEDTWEYDGSAWKSFASPGPGTRAHHCMAYDPVRKVTMLVGGSGTDGQKPETWGWDGASWTKLAEGGPAPRSRARMAFHESSGEMVMYGGDNVPRATREYRVESDTWTWDGKSWRERKPRDTPGPRMMHAMAYHAEMKRVVLYGGKFGEKVRDDVWAWDGENWSGFGS